MPALQMSDAVTSAAAYFATTMLLTPLVTTLGARRPGIAPWHWFVVLPMVVVLQWPAASQLFGSHWRVPVELNAPATILGEVGLVMVEPEERWAELGFWLHRDARGSGRAAAAALLFADWALRELPIDRLFARTHADNPRAGKVATAAGLTRAGALETGTLVWIRDQPS